MIYNPKNERIKSEYFHFKKEADGKDPKSIEAMRNAILRFEEFTKFKNFKTFDRHQAITFKEQLANTKQKATGEILALPTQNSILKMVQTFLKWLALQPGYKSKIYKPDIEFLNLTDKQQRAAQSSKSVDFPSVQQVRHAILEMPSKTEIQLRDRALVACALMTAARVSALATLKLKHFDPSRNLVIQDPKEVDTKFSKIIETFLVPVGDDILQIFLEWVTFLKNEKLFGANEPLFPKTFNKLDENNCFVAGGISREHWAASQSIREIFSNAFKNAGLKYYNPHSFRHTLVHDAMEKGATVEQIKALSQNIGHESIMTTLVSYGRLTTHRQGEVLKGLGRQRKDADIATMLRDLADKL